MENEEKFDRLVNQIRGGKADAYVVAINDHHSSQQLVFGNPLDMLVMLKGAEQSIKRTVEKEGLPYELFAGMAEMIIENANGGQEAKFVKD